MCMHGHVFVEIRTDGCEPPNTAARNGLRASARALCAIQHQAITPAPKHCFKQSIVCFLLEV